MDLVQSLSYFEVGINTYGNQTMVKVGLKAMTECP